jgi:MFS family permease
MPDSATLPAAPAPSAFAAFRSRDFRLLQLAAFASIIGMLMQSVAVGWQLYEITGKPLDLGYVGAALFLPALLFSPLTGHTADRFERRHLLAVCHSVLGCASLLLYGLAQRPEPSLALLYTVLVLVGTARAFLGPAAQAIIPNLVPLEILPNALAWSSTTWQVSIVAGPALGGVLYAQAGASGVYLSGAVLEVFTVATLLNLRTRTTRAAYGGGFRDQFAAGLAFVWKRPVILGAISLDLFAVLFGGAVALLPVYARDILHIGPRGLGLLRSAPALGAVVVALALAYRPVVRRAGVMMFACVLVFGLATIAFGLSRHFLVSLAALAITGAADMVSVFIRHNLVQLRTPDSMRGRVAAVNMIFIGASNELGEFESGALAQWLGSVPAVVIGGIGTCVVVLLWALWFPALRRVDRLDA